MNWILITAPALTALAAVGALAYHLIQRGWGSSVPQALVVFTLPLPEGYHWDVTFQWMKNGRGWVNHQRPNSTRRLHVVAYANPRGRFLGARQTVGAGSVWLDLGNPSGIGDIYREYGVVQEAVLQSVRNHAESAEERNRHEAILALLRRDAPTPSRLITGSEIPQARG